MTNGLLLGIIFLSDLTLNRLFFSSVSSYCLDMKEEGSA